MHALTPMRLSFLAIAIVAFACGSDDKTNDDGVDIGPGSSGGRDGGADGASVGDGGKQRTGLAPSCARERGGQTCGPNGNEDCCTTVKQGSFTLDKYMITAGRMRTFIDAFDGNIQGYVETLPPAKWNAAWAEEDALPYDRMSSLIAFGPYLKKSCNQKPSNGHTYWTPPDEGEFSDFDQATLDDKALNCVSWPLLQAFCIWDGGHLAKLAELRAAFTNNGTTKYPWGNAELARADVPDPEQRLNIAGGFNTTPAPPNLRQPPEVSFLIAPPGRFPKGNSIAGVADSAGNLLEWVGDSLRQFVWKADFEQHGQNAKQLSGSIWWESRNAIPYGFGPWIWGEGQLANNAGVKNERNGYYSIGGRCAH